MQRKELTLLETKSELVEVKVAISILPNYKIQVCLIAAITLRVHVHINVPQIVPVEKRDHIHGADLWARLAHTYWTFCLMDHPRSVSSRFLRNSLVDV